MCIAIVCFPDCDVMNFETNLIFLMTLFETLNFSRTKRALKAKQKAFFIMFTELSVAKNCLRQESVPLILQINLRSKSLAFLQRFHEISNFAREKALSWRNTMTYLFLFNFEFKLEL